ncbi:MAG: ATP-grasp domain-containing protein [Bryobacterales bacterium]|nr:ATP-grasp domain-containing protein [Bryobacterales bacterium]
MIPFYPHAAGPPSYNGIRAVRKRILLLGSITGYQTRVFARTARELGVELVLATDQCRKMENPWGDNAITVRFQHSAAYARRLALEGPFDGIVAVGDHPTLLAAMTAQRLGLPYHSPASVEACRNKYLARRAFQRSGLNVPSYFRMRLRQTAWPPPPFPCVLKPLGLSGSRGVIRADNESEFSAALARIRALLESVDIRRLKEEQNQYVQVESFIEGREFALEGILTAGRLQTLALFDKPDPLDGPYFEESIYVTPSRADAAAQSGIVETVQRAVQALGLTHGPVHAEMRCNSRGVWMLEAAARPIGGLCARALRFRLPGGACPVSLEELVLRHALGEDVAAAQPADPASGVMMIPIPKGGIYHGVSGVAESRSVRGIEDVVVTAKEGQRLTPLPEGSSYLGFIFARGESPEVVEEALRAAHARLRFDIATDLRVFRGV